VLFYFLHISSKISCVILSWSNILSVEKDGKYQVKNAWYLQTSFRGHLGCDHMVVGFTTTCAIGAHHH
jgi:hypothetical protein